MATQDLKDDQKLVKQIHFSRPDWEYFFLEPSKATIDGLLISPIFDKACDRACTKVISLHQYDQRRWSYWCRLSDD
jgi:hypothetical protein